MYSMDLKVPYSIYQTTAIIGEAFDQITAVLDQFWRCIEPSISDMPKVAQQPHHLANIRIDPAQISVYQAVEVSRLFQELSDILRDMQASLLISDSSMHDGSETVREGEGRLESKEGTFKISKEKVRQMIEIVAAVITILSESKNLLSNPQNPQNVTYTQNTVVLEGPDATAVSEEHINQILEEMVKAKARISEHLSVIEQHQQ